MARPLPVSEKLPSKLAADLALSRMGLVALQAKRGQEPAPSDRDLADELSRLVSQKIALLAEFPQVKVVEKPPAPRGRATLVHYMPITRETDVRDVQLLERLLESLKMFVQTSIITPTGAETLLSVLSEYEKARNQ